MKFIKLKPFWPKDPDPDINYEALGIDPPQMNMKWEICRCFYQKRTLNLLIGYLKKIGLVLE